MAWLALILALAAATALALLRHAVEDYGFWVLTWRWHTGMPLDGHDRTNATWLHRSSDVLHRSGHAVRWHHMPRLHRAGIRCGAEMACAASLAGLILAPGIVFPLLASLAFSALAYASWRAWRFARDFRFWLRWVRPLRRTLELHHGVPPRSLKISRDRQTVKLSLPPGWAGTQRERDKVTAIVTSKLGLEIDPAADGDVTWAEKARRPRVIFAAAPPPPDEVLLADRRTLEIIAACGEAEIFAGIGRRGKEIVRSVDTDSPHIGISMGSGRGKSVTAGNAAAQLARQGSLIAVLDVKIVSHRWAKGLPNVAYASRPWQIHDLLLWLEAEISRRNDEIDKHADVDGRVHGSVGTRLTVIMEELNTMQKFLARHWRELRAEDRSLPARSPAQDAAEVILAMGRAGLVNVIAIGQRLSAAAVSGAGGNADARENLGLRYMCDPGPATWRMLGPEIPCPAPRNHPGRHQLVSTMDAREVQAVYAPNRELRMLATAGEIARPPDDMPFTVPSPHAYRGDDGAWTWQAAPRLELVSAAGPRTRTRTPRTAPDLHPVPDPVLDAELVGEAVQAGAQADQVTLAEAVELGIARRNLASARRRSTRDPKHPPSVGKRGREFLYDACDLADYWARAGA